MKVIIIEDESFAVDRLKMLLEELDEPIEVIAVLEGIKQAVKWLSSNTADLIFLDIHLSDGSAFKIFEQVEIRIPIIFTTAYHEYALRAFEQHSIDYLLKPVDRHKLKRSIEKLQSLKNNETNPILSKKVEDFIEQMPASSKPKRFMVKVGNKVKVINLKDVAFFSFDSKLSFLHTSDKNRFVIDSSLKQLDLSLPQKDFFRVNRQYLLGRNCIQELQYISATRVKVVVKNYENDIYVAREKLGNFKQWLLE